MGSVCLQPDAVIADRGGIIENTHLIHAAVVDASGTLLFAVGDPTRVTLARSAAKPAQAVAVLETGAAGTFGFDEADVALMCASHSSEERHLGRARSMLAKVQAGEADLRCGGHPAISEAVNREWARAGVVPTAVHNNCSGKHAGMLGAAKLLMGGTEGYHSLEHPLQLRVREVVEELTGLGEEGVLWAVDGCNLPAPAARLEGMARMFARFAQAVDGAGASPREGRGEVMARVFRAMTRYPEMVGGEGRFCTDFMEAFQGQAIGKVGADGFYGVGVRESPRTRELGAEGALGIAVKVEDGDRQVLYAAVAEILRQLRLGSPEEREKLDAYHHIERKNTAGVVIGRLSFGFKVRSQGPLP